MQIKRQSLHYENRRKAVHRSSRTGGDNGPKERKVLAFGAKTEAEEEDRTGVTGLSCLSGVHTLVWTHIAAFAHSRKIFGETGIQHATLLDSWSGLRKARVQNTTLIYAFLPLCFRAFAPLLVTKYTCGRYWW